MGGWSGGLQKISSGGGSETVGTPNIQNFTAILANTEYAINIPLNTNKFMIKTRVDNVIMRIYSTSGSPSYWTVGFGNFYYISNLDGSGLTLYIQVSKPNTIIETFSWA